MKKVASKVSLVVTKRGEKAHIYNYLAWLQKHLLMWQEKLSGNFFKIRQLLGKVVGKENIQKSRTTIFV